MTHQIQRSAVRDALELYPFWRRLRSAPVALLVLLPAAVAWGADPAGPTMAVLEFRVGVGGTPADFGLAGSRMLARALGATDRYDVIDSNLVEEQVRQQGLRPPFAVGHLQLLADALGADLMAHGSIRGLTYDPAAGSASVILSIEIVDGRSGELKQRQQASGTHSAQIGVRASQQQTLVGALAAAADTVAEALTGTKVSAALQGLSDDRGIAEGGLGPALLPSIGVPIDAPRIGVPRTELLVVSEAPPQPVVSVVQATTPEPVARPPSATQQAPVTQPPGTLEPPPAEMIDDEPEDDLPPLVRAKVLAKLDPHRVLITLGRDGTVAPKMELEVFRVRYSPDSKRALKSRIGKLRVIKVNPTDAEARILEGAEVIRTGDLAYYYGP